MERFVPVEGRLYSERPSARNSPQELGVEGRMIADPLKRGVREDEVIRFGIGLHPFGDVALDPLAVWICAARIIEHFDRAIETCNSGIRPTFGQNRRAISRSATK